MASYDTWDDEPQPDTWDTWDSGGSSGGDLPPPSQSFDAPPCGKGFFGDGKGCCGGGFDGKGKFDGPPMFDGCKGDFGKGPPDFGKGDFGKGPMFFGKGDGKGCGDMGKGCFDGGCMGCDFGKGPGDFGKGPPDFGKGPPMDFGKGGKGDFGKGPMDFGSMPCGGCCDFGKGGCDFGKGDFCKGMGKDMGKDMGCGDFCKGGNDFCKGGKDMGMGPPDMGMGPPMQQDGCGGTGFMMQAKSKGSMPPMGCDKGCNKGMNFDGGKGCVPGIGKPGMAPALQGAPGPSMPGGCAPPPPPMGMAPMPPGPNGNMMPPPFAKAPGMAPELLALTQAEVPAITLSDDAPGAKPVSLIGEKKSRLFLLLTRLSAELKSEHMQQILEQCGDLQAFRRARDPAGKPLSFGFAQFSDAEAVWKATTCLSKLVLCGEEIKVLLEEQTEIVIEQWRKDQQAALKVNTAEELEWELERKSVSCKASVEAKVEEIYGPAKGGGAAAGSKRREELRKKEQARILRVRKRKAWREEQFAKELERVESLEKRLRREERERDGIDRTKEQQSAPRPKDDSELTAAKREEFGDGEAVGTLALANDDRVLHDLVDRIQTESRDYIMKMDLDVKYLREEKTLEKKLRPWLEKKIDLYMGGPQSDLVEHILRRVNGATTAEALISDLQRYLDDNADALVERMWRMLIFEQMRSGQPMGYVPKY